MVPLIFNSLFFHHIPGHILNDSQGMAVAQRQGNPYPALCFSADSVDSVFLRHRTSLHIRQPGQKYLLIHIQMILVLTWKFHKGKDLFCDLYSISAGTVLKGTDMKAQKVHDFRHLKCVVQQILIGYLHCLRQQIQFLYPGPLQPDFSGIIKIPYFGGQLCHRFRDFPADEPGGPGTQQKGYHQCHCKNLYDPVKKTIQCIPSH